MTTAAAHDLARAVAVHGLAGTRLTLPAAPLDDAAWAELVEDIVEERLQGLFAAAVDGGALPADEKQQDEAFRLHETAMVHALLLDRFLVDTVLLLEGAGISPRVLKGAAYAHLVYSDPALRVYGDVDLLVSSADWDGSVQALREAGFERRWPEPRRGFDRRFGKSAIFASPDGHELDLHRTFVQGPFGLTVALGDLFAHPEPFVVGGQTLHALGREERFLHACYHAALGNVPPRLVPLLDVAQHLLDGNLDIDRVLALADRWQAGAVVARAVELTWEEFALSDLVPLSVWARRYEPSTFERRALATYTGADRSYGAKTLASLRVLPSARDRMAFLRALIFPDRGFLARRGTSYRDWWRRGGRAVARRERS